MMSSDRSSTVTVVVLSAVASIALAASIRTWYSSRSETLSPTPIISAYERQIGHTPCILLPVLSKVMNCEIFVKLESSNPGSSGKDRAALAILQAAERDGSLPPPRSTTTTQDSASHVQNTTHHSKNSNNTNSDNSTNDDEE